MNQYRVNEKTEWPGWMTGLVLLFALLALCIFASYADGQTIPDGPRPQPPVITGVSVQKTPHAHGRIATWDFFVGEGAMWGGMLADGIASDHYINRVRCTQEGNPMFRLPGGRLDTRKFYTVNLPIKAAITVVDVVLRRYGGGSKGVRIFATGMAAVTGAEHIYQAQKFLHNDWGC